MTPVLELVGLEKSFGALRVTDGVSLTVVPGECHAMIGPNGAGKTSLMRQIAGQLAPDRGRIRFLGSDVTQMSVARRTRLGMARSFQITSILPQFTCLANVALAAQSRIGSSFRFWDDAGRESGTDAIALAALAEVGLEARALTPADALSHGEQRQLEIAMAVALAPKLLVLDEPMAGAGPHETTALVAVLRRLKVRCAMLLVEHDMSAVFQLADRVSVLVAGRVIASGRPEEVRNDPMVRTAYLGEEEIA